MIIAFSSDNSFENLNESFKKNGLNIDFLVTEKPKKSGRGQTVKPNHAHKYALKAGIKVAAISSNEELESLIEGLVEQKIEAGFVFSFGRIINERVIQLLNNKIVNLHPSLLPKYRGSTPIQTAILNNEKQFGFSVIQINKTCDGGPILYQEKTDVAPDSDYCEIKNSILQRAGLIIPEIMKKFISGKIDPIKQIEENASYTRKFKKTDGFLNDETAQSAYMKIRAFCEWPKAYFEIDSKRIIILKAKLIQNQLEIIELQIEGGKPMDFKSFKNGHSLLLTKLPSFVKI